jgi:hypothetical protein
MSLFTYLLVLLQEHLYQPAVLQESHPGDAGAGGVDDDLAPHFRLSLDYL